MNRSCYGINKELDVRLLVPYLQENANSLTNIASKLHTI